MLDAEEAKELDKPITNKESSPYQYSGITLQVPLMCMNSAPCRLSSALHLTILAATPLVELKHAKALQSVMTVNLGRWQCSA
jgi:hypothetical protein